MKRLILLVAVLALTGCDKFITPTGVNSAEALTRYIDQENGVVCYQAANSKAAFSCVKVR
ncbi:hypothetical protein [Klebsiella pneumoniae]|uniref:hypothetical protein n=1 Tax=Klebsiella pneumoniae TaxID=573 RepID=UPI000D652326|nr:hypothetical protein [Klebsiella pneumoniae]